MSALPAFVRRRWPAIALVASLLLNGFLVGMIATEAFRPHGGQRQHGPRALGFELRRLAERLPGEAVDRISAELQPLGVGLQSRLDRLRAIRQEINGLAAQPTPDRAAIDARLAALRTEAASMQEEVQRATFDALLKLPPDTRAGLAESAAGG
ncbi:MAG: periplasmic heavy metal sensor [Rhizobiales bacterium]|nr:periplasmic heavy metal sensor [Hyphomicrobiales bacterium]MDQ3560394.1 periplasmic heavy metal sensor [Pseudomonadota bacterium]